MTSAWSGDADVAPTVRTDIEEVLPLAPLQEGLLYHADLHDAGPGLYVVQVLVELEGTVRPERLRAAAQALVDRHAVLRVAFRRRRSGEAVQVVVRDVPVDWRDVDLTVASRDDLGTRAAEVADEDRVRRFDPAHPPLSRFSLVRLGRRRWQLVATLHHLVVDGWSLPLLVGELMELYGAAGSGAALVPPAPYRDYLAWVAAQDREESTTEWKRALAGVTPTRLAPAGPATAALPARVIRVLADDLVARLSSMARAHGLTLGSVLQGAWGLLLGRLTGQDDVVFGTAVSGRPAELPGVESIVGLFANTVPVRVRALPGELVRSVLARLQQEQAALLAHHHLPLGEIQATAGAGGELFDTLFVLESYPFDPEGFPATDELRVVGLDGRDATHYPLSVVVLPRGGLTLELVHRPDVLATEAVERIAERFVRLLSQVAAEPDRR
ncbi:MAG: non-ribosomal peptide synthetase, partial [Actinobacteria bacterium]|nr:non-ribosomal peptide synthetase [Actinomycetota bacterium]